MSSRDRSLIAAVVLVVIAVAGYFLVVNPEHSKANQIQAQIGTATTALQQADAEVQQGQAAESQYNGLQRSLKSVAHAVPADQQVPELINQLQAVASRTRVGFVSVNAAASTAPSEPGAAAITFPSQSFSLSFTGSYFAVANLLGDVSNFVRADNRHFKATGRLLSISTVNLSPGGSTGSSTSSQPGDVTASVTALDYDIPSATTAAADVTG